MINTMNNIVTTNLRVPTDDMVLYRDLAKEMDMSFNEYCNWIMKRTINAVQLGGNLADVIKKKPLDLRDLAKEARKIKSVPEYDDFSEDDRIVYGQ